MAPPKEDKDAVAHGEVFTIMVILEGTTGARHARKSLEA